MICDPDWSYQMTTYLKSSKELELSNMQSILEQMDTSNQLRQDEQEKQIRDQEAFNKQSILEQTKSYERRIKKDRMDLANIQKQEEIEKQKRDLELSDMLSKLKQAERANMTLMAETEEERLRNDRINRPNKLVQKKLEEELASQRSVTRVDNKKLF